MTIWPPPPRSRRATAIGVLAIVLGPIWLLSVILRLTGLITLLCCVGMFVGGVLTLKRRRSGRVLCLITTPIALVLATMTLLIPGLQPSEPGLVVFTAVMVAALLVLVSLVFTEHIAAHD